LHIDIEQFNDADHCVASTAENAAHDVR
jgi:hypothetical protein